jgi:hypothetical protein
MFDELIKKYKEHKAIKEWRSSHLGIALERHSREYFYGDNALLGGLSEEGKQKFIGDLLQKVFSFATDEKAFLTYREALASCVIDYASYKVLCLKEDEKEKDTFFSDCPHISGELYKFIHELSQHHVKLKECEGQTGALSDEELIELCNERCTLDLYYIGGLNMVRIELKDFIEEEEKDWLRPFMKSELILQENLYRREISLPSLLPNKFDWIWHSSFSEIVVSGAKNPYYEWEKAQGK